LNSDNLSDLPLISKEARFMGRPPEGAAALLYIRRIEEGERINNRSKGVVRESGIS
jgi:hypothetical protein